MAPEPNIHSKETVTAETEQQDIPPEEAITTEAKPQDAILH